MSSPTSPPPPSHHVKTGLTTTFRNPWPSASKPTVTELLETKFPLGLYSTYAAKHPGTYDVKVINPDWGVENVTSRGLRKGNCIVGTSLGHAGVIVELPLSFTGKKKKETEEGEGESSGKDSFWIVYDPIFSERAGPTPSTGPKREKPAPCSVDDFPGCDAIMISHNHYDHLDLSTITSLLQKFPNARYFVPLGNKAWFHKDAGVEESKIIELDWWQEQDFNIVKDLGFSSSAENKNAVLRFTCVPAQHNSGRSAFDQNTSLWCGWIVESLVFPANSSTTGTYTRNAAIYHAGDTGYRRTAKSPVICPIFAEIGEKYGPFDLSFIPIWRGGTLEFFSHLGIRLDHNDIPSALHAAPKDAIDIHVDVKSRVTIPIHFGTFVGSEDESLESIMEFEEARVEKGVRRLMEEVNEEDGMGRAGFVDIGGSWAVEIKVEEREVERRG